MLHFNVEVTGRSPLLMGGLHSSVTEKIKDRARSGSSAAKLKPLEECLKRMYLSSVDDNRLIIPQVNFFATLVEAGKFFKVGRAKVTTAKGSMVPGFCEVDGIEFPLLAQEEKTKKWLPVTLEPQFGWQIREDSARNPTSGGVIAIWRPMLYTWRFDCMIALDEQEFNQEQFRELVDKAGRMIGLCDWRPARRGPFGKFVVTRWDEVEIESVEAA